jgi:MYXO-CTERM domain-containing protein
MANMEAARKAGDTTLMAIPTELVPKLHRKKPAGSSCQDRIDPLGFLALLAVVGAAEWRRSRSQSQV